MIFSGIEVLFFLLGAMATIGVVIMINFAKKYYLKWTSYTMGASTLFLILFTIAWSWSSALEDEPQAAGLGLIFFGIPALICLFLTRRLILKSEVK
ncbi:MAG: hypothetical protein U9R32_08225 [Bacteroidota bacterium]|nr:hypothetical protein [Bacteroidota bacterium]